MTEQPFLADRTLARLRAYAKDNGLAADSLQIVKANENVYSIEGLVQLTPSLNVETSSSFGRAKGKNKQILPSFSALQEEVAHRRETFEKGGAWLEAAIKELEKEQGHGWGHGEAALTWSDQIIFLAATETCPSCKGSAQAPCLHCQGVGTTPCVHCEGRGQEVCPHCLGQGQEPSNPSKTCPICNGRRYTNCRFCEATGKIVCPHCRGKGGTPCPDCNGTGVLSQEAKIAEGARIDFSLGATSELPSGLLRMMSRIGETNLSKGHADIEMKTAAPDCPDPEERARIRLTARIPYADIKMKIGKGEYIVSAFGKNGRLSGVPAFLDKTTAAARKTLEQAAQGHVPMDRALTVRLLRDGLGLVLAGKTQTNDLRRLYPAGLSGAAAQEIMQNINLALKSLTMEARAMTGGIAVFVCLLLFGGFFFTPLFGQLNQSLSPKLVRVIELLLPLLAMGGAWQALTTTAKGALKRKYPTASVAQAPNIGKIGYSSLAAIAAIYVLFYFIVSSEWFTQLFYS